ncbi:ABC transporter permease [Enterococcus sp. 669A]|uniref:ABC transporter permease n=1 Tax=Candidatus Enterococcus moelleringii TaxID=2815325 RepID=A0ABS3LB64_9ENTE|nr:ABC transporter permease [Enterococcus sp. 669A]MBO1306878.1 ABC transporter permease [Enterococcus sp. 669A]
MNIFKAILQILKQNKGSLLIGVIVMGIITIFYSSQMINTPNELDGVKIAVFDNDKSETSRALVDQLTKQHELVTLKDTSQKGIDDAVYFDEAEYVLTIPVNLEADMAAGKAVKVQSQTKPSTFSKTLVNTTIDHFINTYATFQSKMPNASKADLVTLTKDTLDEEGTVHFDQTYHQKKSQKTKGTVYNLLAYGLFVTIFSGYAAINLVFNRKSIRDRNRCAPISRRKLSRAISLGSFGYAAVCLILFLAFVVFATKGGFNEVTGYFIVNSLLFFSVMVSFSILFSSLLTNSESVGGINNVLIMGTCFVTGVFVPSEVLPDVVHKIAAFTPTYWFVQNNELIGSTVNFNQAFKEEFLHQSLILLAFTLVFVVIHLITMKEKGGLKSFSKKEAAVLE